MRVLIGYDGSPAAVAALRDLDRAGLPRVAQVRVLVDISPILSPEPYLLGTTAVAWYPPASAAIAQIAEQAEAEALKVGKQALDFLKANRPDWKSKLQVTNGVPAAVILREAEAWKPHLIVLGSRGWTRLGKILMGSTAERVLAQAHGCIRIARPVVRKKASAPRLLIGVDGSRDSDAALSEVARRNWPKGTQALLLAVMDLRLNLNEVMTGIDKASKGNQEAGQWPWMKKKLLRMQAKLAAKGLKVSLALVPGEPRSMLLDQAGKLQVDCIFLGSRGLSGIQRFMMGSVASGVAAHAPCSVEVIRPAVNPKR